MTAPAALDHLADLARDYDVLLSDVWGVIHNGRERFPVACEALARWRAEVGPVVLISNAARPATEVVRQLDDLGISREVWSAFVTSGDATRPLLAARAPGPVWTIGWEGDSPLYEGLNLAYAGPDEAAFISVTGPNHDESETPEDYRAALTLAAERDLPMICVNPDIVVQRGDRLIYCGGALAQLYEQLGGEAHMAGKPHSPIYDLALAEGERALGRPLDRKRVLCVGDGVVTDVRGANAQGLDALFIAAGIHGAEAIGADGRAIPEAVETLLAAEAAHARYAMAELVW